MDVLSAIHAGRPSGAFGARVAAAETAGSPPPPGPSPADSSGRTASTAS